MNSSVLLLALKTMARKRYEGLGSAGGESTGLATVCGSPDDIEGRALD